MSLENKFFLDGNQFKDENGLSAHLKLTFTSEQELDEALWFDPEAADKPLRNLLQQHKGEMTPTLSRLALKALAIPLFTREFLGESTTPEIDTEVAHVSTHMGVLLDAYLDRINNSNYDQRTATNALVDAAFFALNVRDLGSNDTDDIIMLPIAPANFYISENVNFTTLRRKSLGRAQLIMSPKPDIEHKKEPHLNTYRIFADPTEMIGDDASVEDLAEALISDSMNAATPDEATLIAGVSERFYSKISSGFDLPIATDEDKRALRPIR